MIASVLIEVTDTGGRLIRENDRAFVLGKPFNKTLLVFPTETASRVLRELDIVGRIRVDEVTILNLKLGKVSVTKVPVLKLLYEGAEVRRVVDRLITAKGDIEMTRLIKPAEPVKASAVEVVEELSRFARVNLAIGDQSIKPASVAVVELGLVTSLNV